jgi:hypothetical protein
LSARNFLETEKFIVYRKIVFGIFTGRIEHNVLQLGEVADLEALTFNLALNFI